jgi:hypothetical protein
VLDIITCEFLAYLLLIDIVMKTKKEIKTWQIYSGEWVAAYADDLDNILFKARDRRILGFKIIKLKEGK